MKKTWTCIILAMIVTISVAGIWSYQLLEPYLTEREFDWAVEEGMILHYNVSVYAYRDDWMYESSYNRTSYWNDITLEIVSLPVLVGIHNPDEFIDIVVTPDKTTNTTQVMPENYTLLLVEALSFLLLPINEWEWLDQVFADEVSMQGSYPDDSEVHFASAFEDDSFYFQRTLITPVFPNWDTTDWKGHIDMASGVPHFIRYEKYIARCTSFGRISLNATLTS